MMKTWMLLVPLVVAATIAAAQGPSPQASATQGAPTPQAPPGNAEKGKELFTTYFCYSCHGSDGQGGAGARIAPNPPSFNAVRNYLRKPSGSMPPYTSKALPDRDLQDIYAYLRSIPPAQPVRNIPLLNQ